MANKSKKAAVQAAATAATELKPDLLMGFARRLWAALGNDDYRELSVVVAELAQDQVTNAELWALVPERDRGDLRYVWRLTASTNWHHRTAQAIRGSLRARLREVLSAHELPTPAVPVTNKQEQAPHQPKVEPFDVVGDPTCQMIRKQLSRGPLMLAVIADRIGKLCHPAAEEPGKKVRRTVSGRLRHMERAGLVKQSSIRSAWQLTDAGKDLCKREQPRRD